MGGDSGSDYAFEYPTNAFEYSTNTFEYSTNTFEYSTNTFEYSNNGLEFTAYTITAYPLSRIHPVQSDTSPFECHASRSTLSGKVAVIRIDR